MGTPRVSSFKHQSAHGFNRGQPLVFTGGVYAKATTATGFDGVCGTIPDTNRFELVTGGELDGMTGLTPEQTLYLSTVAGVLSTTGTVAVLRASLVDRAWVQGRVAAADTTALAEAAAASAASIAARIAAAIAAEVVRADAAYAAIAHLHNDKYLHSVEYDGVISVTPGASGVVFLESDGTQVLTG